MMAGGYVHTITPAKNAGITLIEVSRARCFGTSTDLTCPLLCTQYHPAQTYYPDADDQLDDESDSLGPTGLRTEAETDDETRGDHDNAERGDPPDHERDAPVASRPQHDQHDEQRAALGSLALRPSAANAPISGHISAEP